MAVQKSAEAIVSALRRRRAEPLIKESVLSNRKDMERRQVAGKQLELFQDQCGPVCHDAAGEGGTQSGAVVERQVSSSFEEQRALTQDLMQRVASPVNLSRAVRRVCRNKGAGGVDGMEVGELKPWFHTHWRGLREQLLEGRYRPSEVLGVEIPKPSGGVRQLGIPTVVDRVVQQALLQALEPLWDPTFSESSFGFRPRRGAHQALKQASKYVGDGRLIVVDIDLEKFFDRVNHDVLMGRVMKRVSDKRVLRLIRRFLQAGMMREGVHVARYEGTPQGGPLSPILANLLLDDLDKELERRGHKFCRYADDCNIYVRTKVAGERVLQSVTRFIETKLRLRVNRAKSAVAFVEKRKFLGYRLRRGGKLGIAPVSLHRAKERIRSITRRNRGHVTFKQMVAELNSFLGGWITYFRLAECKTALQQLGTWMRRKLRCVSLKRLKRAMTTARFLQRLGVPEWRAWILALSGKGWWRKAGSPQANEAMNHRWFTQHGLIDPVHKYLELQN